MAQVGKESFIKTGSVSIRPMQDADDDYQLLSQWLTDPEVLEWVYGRDKPQDLINVRDKYGPLTRGEGSTTPCFILYRSQPVGYVQFTSLNSEDSVRYGIQDVSMNYSIDLWIGDTTLWSQGIGTTTVTAMVQYLKTELGATNITIDPREANTRAIRCYEKSGFTKAKLIERGEYHEGKWQPCWLMMTNRQQCG